MKTTVDMFFDISPITSALTLFAFSMLDFFVAAYNLLFSNELGRRALYLDNFGRSEESRFPFSYTKTLSSMLLIGKVCNADYWLVPDAPGHIASQVAIDIKATIMNSLCRILTAT